MRFYKVYGQQAPGFLWPPHYILAAYLTLHEIQRSTLFDWQINVKASVTVSTCFYPHWVCCLFFSLAKLLSYERAQIVAEVHMRCLRAAVLVVNTLPLDSIRISSNIKEPRSAINHSAITLSVCQILSWLKHRQLQATHLNRTNTSQSDQSSMFNRYAHIDRWLHNLVAGCRQLDLGTSDKVGGPFVPWSR